MGPEKGGEVDGRVPVRDSLRGRGHGARGPGGRAPSMAPEGCTKEGPASVRSVGSQNLNVLNRIGGQGSGVGSALHGSRVRALGP
jgi:hypothetical protein